ncbi:MAG: HldE protein, partial [Chlamydiae bacterium]|nr:HldE protein [Chlamydiota bacterium]
MKDGNLADAFHRIRPFSALVLGDFVLDTYTTGRVKRISPEAPVPILEVIKQESHPGGAGNVVLNLLALDAKVKAIGRVGEDEEGKNIYELLQKAGADVSSLITASGYQTPVKNRLIAESQQLLRFDFEKIEEISLEIEKIAIKRLEERISSVQIVAISDYGKGFLSRNLISQTIALARRHNVPCIVDPKGIDFAKYRGATL